MHLAEPDLFHERKGLAVFLLGFTRKACDDVRRESKTFPKGSTELDRQGIELLGGIAALHSVKDGG